MALFLPRKMPLRLQMYLNALIIERSLRIIHSQEDILQEELNRFGKYNHKFIKVHIGFPDAFIYLPLLQD